MKIISLSLLCLMFAACASKKSLLPPTPSGEPQREPEAVYRIEFDQVPEVGKTTTGQKIFLGGFSGLRYLGKTEEGKLRFVTNTDQGPLLPKVNGPEFTQRPLVLPDFQPRLVFFEVDLLKKTAQITRQLLLKQPNGKPLSGKMPKLDKDRSTDMLGKLLPFDVYGMDLEAIDIAEDGSYWMAEQYGPSIAHFSKQGGLLNLLKPGKGLPKIFEMRKDNRGFESVAVIGKKVYATMQGLISKNTSRILRVVEVDLLGARTLGQYVYMLEADGGQKIDDIATLGARRMLFLEKGRGKNKEKSKKVYFVDLTEASNLQLFPERIVGLGGNLEEFSEKDLLEENIKPAKKKLVIDLEAVGARENRIEGMDLVEGSYLALISDNNFMLTGKWNKENNSLELNQEKSVFYLVKIDEENLEF